MHYFYLERNQWEKLGLVLPVDKFGESAPTRVMVPTPILLAERVFVTVCDQDNIGRPYYVDLDARDPTQVLSVYCPNRHTPSWTLEPSSRSMNTA